MAAPYPKNEAERLKVLQHYGMLESPPEEDFEDLIYLASEICQTPICLISLIDEHRQWFKAKKGINTCETHRDHAFCAHAILDSEILVIPDATLDERFVDNPLVTGDPQIRFYAGAPLITPSQHRLGTLCVIDRRPRQLSTFQLNALEMLARQVVKQLELRLRNKLLHEKFLLIQKQKEAISSILQERDLLIEQLKGSNRVRERVLSVMAHDLRSPLSNIQLLLSFIGEDDIQDVRKYQHNIRELSKTFDITTDLLDNLLEWGMTQNFEKQELENIKLSPLLLNVMDRLQQKASQKNITLKSEVPQNLCVKANNSSLSLILRNLLTNAIKYSEGGEVLVEARLEEENIRITVSDKGIGMDETQIKQLFFWNRYNRRGTANEKGSGLGLPMCYDVLRHMNGQISAESEPGAGTKMHIFLPAA